MTASPALSLFARPGDGSIRTRRVAILVADGCDGAPLDGAGRSADRRRRGAALRRRRRSVAVQPADGDAIEVDVSLEAAPAVLYDALVLPDGDRARSTRSRADGRTLEFIKDQYRHCKPILALGASDQLLRGLRDRHDAARRASPIPGCSSRRTTRTATDDFIAAIAKHRHFARETDPPRVYDGADIHHHKETRHG